MNVLITGAYSGLGYSLGCDLARRGHTVYMTVETDEQLLKLRMKLKRDMIEAFCFRLNIITDDVWEVDRIDVDCLINNAAVGIGGSVLYMDINDFRNNYEVNVFSSFALLKRVYHNMVKRGKKGKLIVMSSAAAYLSFPFLGCYTSSKVSISALCKCLKKELKYLNNGISITLVEPGAYHTGFNQIMIENKGCFLNKASLFYKDRDKINKIQKFLFRVIEKDDWSDLVEKIVYEIEKDNPKFIIRKPWYLSFALKLYFLFWY